MNKHTVSFIFVFIVSAFLFQNCSKVSFDAIQQQSVSPVNTEAVNTQTIRSLEPALAVRAVGCIQCHANITSNFVTDFGYGDRYYFGRDIGGALYSNGSPYTDHSRAFNSITMASDKQIFVPKANLPSEIARDLNLSTLADYIKTELSLDPDAGTKQVQVTEVDSVIIGAPTETDLKSAFNLGSNRMKFLKSAASDLSGLSDQGSYFQNSGTLVCDGDLIVQGPLYLKDLNIKTDKGCRIYVIGSVFENGVITYVDKTELSNLQITASRSINFGLGKTTQTDGTFCDPTSHVAKGGYGDNTVVNRYTQMWTVPGQSVRGSETPQQFGQHVVDDMHAIENGLGSVLKDAECSGGREVSFERLLLNAPVVMSRYRGDVKGTIIAEFALMSLSQFKFEFDPVFKNVDVLPKLTQSQFIQFAH